MSLFQLSSGTECGDYGNAQRSDLSKDLDHTFFLFSVEMQSKGAEESKCFTHKMDVTI